MTDVAAELGTSVAAAKLRLLRALRTATFGQTPRAHPNRAVVRVMYVDDRPASLARNSTNRAAIMLNPLNLLFQPLWSPVPCSAP